MRSIFYIILGAFLMCLLMAVFMSPNGLNELFNRFWLAAGNLASFGILCAFFGFIGTALYRWATRR